MKPTKRPFGETEEQRIIRKATDIRAALIETGVVFSPDADKTLTELPLERQLKWIMLAREYTRLFPTA